MPKNSLYAKAYHLENYKSIDLEPITLKIAVIAEEPTRRMLTMNDTTIPKSNVSLPTSKMGTREGLLKLHPVNQQEDDSLKIKKVITKKRTKVSIPKSASNIGTQEGELLTPNKDAVNKSSVHPSEQIND